MPAEAWEPVRRTYAAVVAAEFEDIVGDASAELAAAVQSVHDLVRRCVLTPSGLAFVTGEGGLLPNRALHERLDAALETVRFAVSRYR